MNQAGIDRQKRIMDAIQLKIPDRVPIFLKPSFLAARYSGITYEDAYYDQNKWLEANRKFIYDFEPDMFFLVDSCVVTPGPIHDLWGTQQMKWPGHGIGVNSGHQFIESENMKQQEYDQFIDDPSDFLLRFYTPRLFKNLEGLSKLPSLKTLSSGYFTAGFMAGSIADPQVTEALEAILKASKIGAEWGRKFDQFHKEIEEEGFVPSHTQPVVVLPFDIISGYLRGMRGTMMDMFKVPDKLLAAQEKLLPSIIRSAVFAAKAAGKTRISIPLHRGGDGFMSAKQFETFYWPQLKKLINALVDEGLTPMPFFEGVYNSRLEYLAELPKGKTMGVFDRSDMTRVKEVLKDTMCIVGGMPSSLLQTGTSESVKEYTKNLIDVVGKDGGYIMCANTVLEDAKPELIKVWVDFTKEYGIYR
jgi:uroporphyrinogen-III decarboxylase